MTDEEQAVILAAKAWNKTPETQTDNKLSRAVDALLASEQPSAPVFPDPPTEIEVWQHTSGYLQFQEPITFHDEYRRLYFTLTPADEPTCVCGHPTTLGSVHRADRPCFVFEQPPDPFKIGSGSAIFSDKGYTLHNDATWGVVDEPDDLATFHAEQMKNPDYAAAFNALQPAPTGTTA